MSKRIYVTALSGMLFILYNIIIIFHAYYISTTENNKANEQRIVRLNDTVNEMQTIIDFFGVGGEGEELLDGEERDFIREILDKYSIQRYGWRFDDVIPPFDAAYITSEYGARRKGYKKIFRIMSTDFKGTGESRIRAGYSGIVSTGVSVSNGKWLKISKDEKNYLVYSHLNELFFEDGDNIEAGEFLGIQGNTGHCMILKAKRWRDITEEERKNGRATHLDFVIVKNGIHRNPVFTSQTGKYVYDGDLSGYTERL